MTGIRKAREAIGFTQVEFGLVMGVHPLTVSKWERGVLEPSEYQLEIVSHVRAAGARAGVKAKRELYRQGPVGALRILLR